MASAILEAILQRLLVPDNDVIQQATKDLTEAFKDPGIVPALCECLAASESPQVRQYAAILLRRRLVKLWKKMSEVDKASIKQLILTALSKETERLVCRNIAQLVAMVASSELEQGRWNEVIAFIECNSVSSNPAEREVALVLLCNILESTPDTFIPKFTSLLNLFANTLQDGASKLIPYYTIKCMSAIAEFIGDDHLSLFQSLLPMVLQVLRTLVVEDDDYASQAMELFDEMLESEVDILAPVLSSVVTFLLEVGKNEELGDRARVKAFFILSRLVDYKKKQTISSPGVLSTVVGTALAVMASGQDQEDEDGDDIDEDLDDDSPYCSAAKLLDSLSLSLSPKSFYPLVVQMVQPWFTGGNPKQLKAAILSIAVICEGCSEYIRENGQLQGLLEYVYSGLQHPAPAIRNVSLFAIGQFSLNLQPDIGQYASSVLPVLLDHLLKVVATFATRDKSNRSLAKAFYALDSFCESLRESIVPFMPSIMEKVLHMYTEAQGLAIKEFIVSTFGAIASAAEDKFLPYFPQVVKILEECLGLQCQSDDMVVLHGQAIDTLGVLARTVGRENFLPLVPNCMAMGKTVMNSDDPDLRRSVYGMFASLSVILKEDMAADLQAIVIKMLEALQIDAIEIHYDEPGSEGGMFDFDSIDAGDDDDDDDDEDLTDMAAIKSLTVENSYMEEKEDACNSLGTIAANTGVAFLPHFDDVFREMTLLLDDSAIDIRKASSSSLGQLCEAWLALWDQLSESDRVELRILLNTTLQALISAAFTDQEKLVVPCTLQSVEDVLRACKGRLQLEVKTATTVMDGIQQFLSKKAMSQCGPEEEQGTDDDDDAEIDRLVIEGAGCLIPPLVYLVGPALFMSQIEAFVPALLKTLTPNCSVGERSYAVGVLGELLDALGPESVRYSRVLEVFLLHLTDPEEEVRSNAAFGAGILAAHAHSVLSPHYGMVLQKLFAQIEQESDSRCKDNIVAAVCRMIMAKPDCVPLEQVVPVLLSKLPISEDRDEYRTVYQCLRGLTALKHPTVLNSLTSILGMYAGDFPKLDPESKLHMKETLLFLSQNCATEFQTACTGLSQDQLQILTSILN